MLLLLLFIWFECMRTKQHKQKISPTGQSDPDYPGNILLIHPVEKEKKSIFTYGLHPAYFNKLWAAQRVIFRLKHPMVKTHWRLSAQYSSEKATFSPHQDFNTPWSVLGKILATNTVPKISSAEMLLICQRASCCVLYQLKFWGQLKSALREF